MHILWLKTELLHPVDKGGKIRTYHMLKALKREHRVTYLTLDDGTAEPNAVEKAFEYCHELITVPHATSAKFSPKFYAELAQNLMSPLPYFMKKYESAAMREAIQRRLSQGDVDVLVCDFLNPSINLPAKTNCATLLFQHNVEAMIWQRHYEVQSHPLKKTYLKDQWKKSVAYEKAACQRFDYVAAVSADDAETMRREYGVTRVSDVPTGVDTEFFKPSGNETVNPHSLVFTGSMDWLPNEDAIRYFTEAILPLIKQQIPDVKLTVVGRNPFPSLVELSQRDPSIIVTGRVDDVRPYMERAAAYVIPLRIGGGTRLKVYEAMAMEMPIVSTTIGAEGLPVNHEQELLLADEPQPFANSVIRVLRDQELAQRLGQEAAQTVRDRFGWEGVTTEFVRRCEYARAHRKPLAAGAR
ncbi:MAG: glycosyltransferase, partial [Acidobacteria bacterium]|nr:glycosyltransferase [Acidobacteriota bacterium]